MSARLVVDDPRGRAAAIDVLRAGGLVGLPTDTVYGIAVALDAPAGIERLFAAKRRPSDRAIMVLADALDQLTEIVDIPPQARVLAAACWPGGLTLVLPVRTGVRLPAALSAGTPTLGVRVPDHPAPRALARAVGPIPTTSANLHGEPAALDGRAVLAALGEALDLVLDDGPARGGVASTVVDCSAGPPRLIRAGAIPAESLAIVLDDADLPHLLVSPTD
jgi:L-threonylcarbamoyladenylate synthase